MKASFKSAGAILAVVALLAQARVAEAAEIKALCAVGMQDVMTDLAPMFERATGHKLTLTFATGGATVQRARDGEAVDVIIAPASGVDGLVKDGKIAAMIGFIMQQIHQNNGGIILMHDIHQSTADHLDEILTRMEADGFTFARLDDKTVLPKLNGVQAKFIGDTCTTNSDCTYTANNAPGTCSAAGFCTAACTTTCPDASGKAGTFCIANPAGPSVGMCVVKSAPQNSSCALLTHTSPRTLPRFSDPNVSALVCAPN